MSERSPVAVFVPSGRRGAVDPGTTVLDAARQFGVDLDSVCGGRGICGRCQVEPAFGEFAKHGLTSAPEHLSPFSATERAYHGRRALAAGARLGCAAQILGDLVIDVPPDSQVHRPVVRKAVDLTGLVVDPVVRLHYVEVDPAALGEGRSDLRILLDALHAQWSLSDLEIDLGVLADLQPALADGKHCVTVAVHDGTSLTAIWPGFVDTAYGVAVDVGSTTIAGHLCDLASGEVVATAGAMNPQIRFGEDLMSRVSYVMMNPGGRQQLTEAVRAAVDDLVGELTQQAAVERADVLDLVAVGNPIMHHLLLGIDPTPLGAAPFALATDLPVDARAGDIDVACPRARLHVLPCIAGHVGADAAAAILAEGPHRGDEVQLLVDVGTNAEIVLGTRDWLLAASSPTGPAFEGAQISSGQRATPGAIERVRIDHDTLEPRFKVVGSDAWSDDAGFEASLPPAGVTGICGSGIIEVVAELFLAGLLDADGTIDGGAAARTDRIVPDGRVHAYVLHHGEADRPALRITQNDVRAIQLAKAALQAGIRLLMDHAGLASLADVGSVRLAGAFGSHIDPLYALVLGLLPDCPPERVVSVGNAAGSGAVRALLSGEARREIAEVARTVTKIETAIEPRFQEHFVASLAFPHASDPYPNLALVVPLPPRRTAGSPTSPRRRRGRPRPEDTGS
ncbi:MAG TPA: ASKHA domain-containing protein [Acidimicrobiales bacterium]|nr:ASKHA domain-containing protein [Acidimicrobiales bacterium]